MKSREKKVWFPVEDEYVGYVKIDPTGGEPI